MKIFRSGMEYDFKLMIELGHSSRWLTYAYEREKQRIIEWLNEN